MKMDQEIEYTDRQGNDHKGVIVGVKKAEIDGKEQVFAYLVDTGIVERTEIVIRDHRAEEIERRATELLSRIPEEDRATYDYTEFNKEVEKIRASKNLPKEGQTEEVVNHPLVIEVIADKVKAIK